MEVPDNERASEVSISMVFESLQCPEGIRFLVDGRPSCVQG
jgi:hypothetical protein